MCSDPGVLKLSQLRRRSRERQSCQAHQHVTADNPSQAGCCQDSVLLPPRSVVCKQPSASLPHIIIRSTVYLLHFGMDALYHRSLFPSSITRSKRGSYCCCTSWRWMYFHFNAIDVALFFGPAILRTLRSGQGNGNLLVLSSGMSLDSKLI
jgi:hypothetical protein